MKTIDVSKLLLIWLWLFFTGWIAIYAQTTPFQKLQNKYENGELYLTSGPLMDIYSLHTNSETTSQLALMPGGTNLPTLYSFILRIGGDNISKNISFLKLDLIRRKAAYISPEYNQGSLTYLSWDEKQVEDIAIWVDRFLNFSYSVHDFSLSLKANPPSDLESTWSKFNDLKENVLTTVYMEELLNYEMRNFIDSSGKLGLINDSDSSEYKGEILHFLEKYDMEIYNVRDKILNREPKLNRIE